MKHAFRRPETGQKKAGIMQDLKSESEVFTAAWQLLKRYRHIQPGEWAAALQDAHDIYTRATGDTAALAKALALGVLDYIEKANQ